jgi:hypothetical protein
MSMPLWLGKQGCGKITVRHFNAATVGLREYNSPGGEPARGLISNVRPFQMGHD